MPQNINDQGYAQPGLRRGHWVEVPELKDIPQEQQKEMEAAVLESGQDMFEDMEDVILPENPTEEEVNKDFKRQSEEIENMFVNAGLLAGAKFYEDQQALMKQLDVMFSQIKIMLDLGRDETTFILNQNLDIDDPALLDPLIEYSEKFHTSVQVFTREYWTFQKQKNPHQPESAKFKEYYREAFKILSAYQANVNIQFCALMNFLGELYDPVKDREGYIWAQANVCAKLEGTYEKKTVEEIKTRQNSFFKRSWDRIKKFFTGINKTGRSLYEFYLKIKDRWYIRMLLLIWRYRVLIVFVLFVGGGVIGGAGAWQGLAKTIFETDVYPWTMDWIQIFAEAICAAAMSPYVQWTTAGYVAEILVGVLMKYTKINVIIGEKMERFIGTFTKATTTWIVPVLFHRIIKESILWSLNVMCLAESVLGRLGIAVLRPLEAAAYTNVAAVKNIWQMVKNIASDPLGSIQHTANAAVVQVELYVNYVVDFWKYMKFDLTHSAHAAWALMKQFVPNAIFDIFNTASTFFSNGYKKLESAALTVRSYSDWIGLTTPIPEKEDPTVFMIGWFLQIKQSSVNRMFGVLKSIKDAIANSTTLEYIIKGISDSWVVEKLGNLYSWVLEGIYLLWSLFNWAKEVFFAFNVHYRLAAFAEFEKDFATEFASDLTFASRLKGDDITRMIKAKKVQVKDKLQVDAKGIYEDRVKVMLNTDLLDVLMGEHVDGPEQALAIVPFALFNKAVENEIQLRELWEDIWNLNVNVEGDVTPIMVLYLQAQLQEKDPAAFYLDSIFQIGYPYKHVYSYRLVKKEELSEPAFREALQVLRDIMDSFPDVISNRGGVRRSANMEMRLRRWMGELIPPIIWKKSRDERRDLNITTVNEDTLQDAPPPDKQEEALEQVSKKTKADSVLPPEEDYFERSPATLKMSRRKGVSVGRGFLDADLETQRLIEGEDEPAEVESVRIFPSQEIPDAVAIIADVHGANDMLDAELKKHNFDFDLERRDDFWNELGIQAKRAFPNGGEQFQVENWVAANFKRVFKQVAEDDSLLGQGEEPIRLQEDEDIEEGLARPRRQAINITPTGPRPQAPDFVIDVGDEPTPDQLEPRPDPGNVSEYDRTQLSKKELKVLEDYGRDVDLVYAKSKQKRGAKRVRNPWQYADMPQSAPPAAQLGPPDESSPDVTEGYASAPTFESERADRLRYMREDEARQDAYRQASAPPEVESPVSASPRVTFAVSGLGHFPLFIFALHRTHNLTKCQH